MNGAAFLFIYVDIPYLERENQSFDFTQGIEEFDCPSVKIPVTLQCLQPSPPKTRFPGVILFTSGHFLNGFLC
ncbi:MAG: hypothetical protein JSV71_04115, partial [Nitrospiraceae bacterium]